jgi:Amt family ammonium transporter
MNKLIMLIGGLLLSQSAYAEGITGADTAWIMTATALVLFMTLPGLSLFYGGLVRSKNVLSVLMQCFTIACVMSLLWLLVGYSLAFGDGGSLNAFIGGLDNVLLAQIGEDTESGTIPESVFALFQMTFAIITPALIVGGFAERMRFSAVVLFSSAWLILVYAPICHWVWGGGWLSDLGVMDFAGGIVVHITAGVAALVAAMVLGNRKGFPTQAMPPHNMTLSIMGAGMLWVGWFGFNGGSALAANGDAGMAMLVTHISAAAGACTWMLLERINHGKASALGAVTGMVAGLGTITPASWLCRSWRRVDHRFVGRLCLLLRHRIHQAHTENRRFAGCVSRARCGRHSRHPVNRCLCEQRAGRVWRARRHRHRRSGVYSNHWHRFRNCLHGRRNFCYLESDGHLGWQSSR